MSDVNISKFRAQVVRDGSKPATPGFVVSEGQNPTDPAGSGQNHLPVTIAAASTGLAITESQVLGGAGTVAQYIRGDGSLADFPATTGGGSSVSYYLNGSVSQGTIGGVAYLELNRMPIFGAGTDITRNSDGYIASFITDAGDPNKLEIPAGNWNLETYFSASSGGGNPSFYVELYKYNGSTFTLIATSSGTPELIAFGTNINPYFSTLAVPQTTLALTDRLALRYYVTTSGRTITLHTENNHLCQVITTFTTGLTALNGLTTQVQFFAVGTSGTDFAISSATDTHTFNLPTASATNRGALSSADWSTFNAKMPAITFNSPLFIASGGEVGITQSSGSTNGFLSSTDWTTFNNKQNALTNPVTGTGTTNYLPKFTGSTTIGDSVIADNATEINIPKRIFLNSGGQSIFFTPNLSSASNRIEGSSGVPLEIFTSGSALRFAAGGVSTQVTLLSSGNVGIGTTSPDARLQVVGSFAQQIRFGTNTSVYTNISMGTGFTTFDSIGGDSGAYSFRDDGVTRMFIDSSGNLGLGVTPSAWGLRGFDISNGSLFGDTNNVGLTQNAYYGSSWVYKNNGTAANYIVVGNEHRWNIAPSGTAGNAISFTQAMTLTSGGNLLVGTTTDAGFKLDVNGTGRFSGNVGVGTAPTSTDTLSIANTNARNELQFIGSEFTNIYSQTTSGIQFGITSSGNSAGIDFLTNNSIKLSITSGGNVGIGTTSPDVFGRFYTQTLGLSSSGSTAIQINGGSGGYGQIDFGAAGVRTAGISASANETQWGSVTSIPAIIYTNNTERMRITSGGEVLIGTTTNSATSGVGNKFVSNGRLYSVSSLSDNTQESLSMYSTGAANYRFYVGWGGTIYATSTSISGISDISLKTNIRDLEKGLTDILKLKPRKFDWKNGDGINNIGFIAQEIEKVFPELISEYKYNEYTTKKSLKMGDLIPSLVKAIQELKQEIDTLKN